MNSEIPPLGIEGFRARLELAIGSDDKPWAWAKRYERGNNAPSASVLLHLAELGANVNWLLTGRGAMTAEDGPRGEDLDLDEAMLAMVIEELERFRTERELSWSAERQARLITYGYAMMLAEKKGGRDGAPSFRLMLKAAS